MAQSVDSPSVLNCNAKMTSDQSFINKVILFKFCSVNLLNL